MLTVAEDVLQQLAAERGKQVSTHLYGQEINAETYAICKADLLLKGEGDAADNIVGGPEHSTLANDAFPSREFDFMLSNPPYGKSWKTDLERMGGKSDMRDPRFVIEHAGDPEYSLVTRGTSFSLGLFQTVAGNVGFQNDAVMHEAVDGRGRGHRVLEGLIPFGKRQIAGDHDTAAFVQ